MIDLSNKKYFIFDLDGTMVDLENLNYSCFRDACKKVVGTILSYEEYQNYFAGAGSVQGFTRYFTAKNITKTQNEIIDMVNLYRAEKEEKLVNHFSEVVSLIPGIKDFLTRAKQLRKNLVVGTSTAKHFALLVLEKAELVSYFDSIVTVDDVIKSKPSPDIFLKAMESVSGNREESIIFEDTKNGLLAAKNAGIDCIIVSTVGKNDQIVAQSKQSIASYDEILI